MPTAAKVIKKASKISGMERVLLNMIIGWVATIHADHIGSLLLLPTILAI